jgi:hypothetical protein
MTTEAIQDAARAFVLEYDGLRFSAENAKIAAAFVVAQRDFGTVVKDKTAKIASTKGAYSYAYADLGSALDAVLPALLYNKIAVLQPVGTTESGWIAVHTTLLHESGQWMGSTLKMKPTNSDPQSAGSAITYARRYALLATCGLAAEDDDGKHASRPHEPSRVSKDPPARPGASAGTERPANGIPEGWTVDTPGAATKDSLDALGRWLGALSSDTDFTMTVECAMFHQATNGRISDADLGLLSENEARRLGKLLKPRVEALADAVTLDSPRGPAATLEDEVPDLGLEL